MFQGDYGQSHKFCAADSDVPDFYSYGRTMHVTFKSEAFITGNILSLTYQVAGTLMSAPNISVTIVSRWIRGFSASFYCSVLLVV